MVEQRNLMSKLCYGSLYFCLIAFAAVAQENAPAAAPKDGAPATVADQQTAPPQQTTPPQTTPPQTTPPATPAQTTPPDQTQQTPSTGPTVNQTPEIPKYPDVRLPGETGWWLGITAWIPREHPIYDRGKAATFPQASLVTLQGSPKAVEGLEFGVAAGLHNSIRIVYFTGRAAGNFTAGSDLTLGTQTYAKGTLLSTDYKLSVFKIGFDYLTWPYPVESKKYRLHTLWQLQYVSMRTGFDAPLLPLVDSNGNPFIDINGNPVNYQTSQSRWFISPTLGANWTQYINKDVRLEFNGSGFAIPHHWTIWDADASLNVRLGSLELRGGVKAFHYHTSPQDVYFVRNTMANVFVGARWYF
ncbi:MAG TPA: hypothetical protein VN736_15510 [Candidatus Limnocylindrales bacterium]|nr:hypothetical protein [Candidatus Limnocylindrales bacterium]